MKKLISAQSVRQAFQDGLREISAPPASVIVTPEARTIAENLGVKILDEKKMNKTSSRYATDEELVQQIKTGVLKKIPSGEHSDSEIETIIRDVLAGR